VQVQLLIDSLVKMNLQQMLGNLGGNLSNMGPGADIPVVDTAEMTYVSSLALLKMLKHGINFLAPKLNNKRSRWSSYGSYGSHARRIRR
jgi:hypothetical protein